MRADVGVIDAASLWLELHCDEAVPEARKMAATLQAKGDLDGADAWLRIIVVIEEMRDTPKDGA